MGGANIRKSLRSKLEVYCKITGKSKRQIIHEALEKYLEEEFAKIKSKIQGVK